MANPNGENRSDNETAVEEDFFDAMGDSFALNNTRNPNYQADGSLRGADISSSILDLNEKAEGNESAFLVNVEEQGAVAKVDSQIRNLQYLLETEQFKHTQTRDILRVTQDRMQDVVINREMIRIKLEEDVEELTRKTDRMRVDNEQRIAALTSQTELARVKNEKRIEELLLQNEEEKKKNELLQTQIDKLQKIVKAYEQQAQIAAKNLINLQKSVADMNGDNN